MSAMRRKKTKDRKHTYEHITMQNKKYFAEAERNKLTSTLPPSLLLKWDTICELWNASDVSVMADGVCPRYEPTGDWEEPGIVAKSCRSQELATIRILFICVCGVAAKFGGDVGRWPTATKAYDRCWQTIGRCHRMGGVLQCHLGRARDGFELSMALMSVIVRGNNFFVSGGEASKFTIKYVGDARFCPLIAVYPFLPFFVPGFYIRDLCRKCTGIFRT